MELPKELELPDTTVGDAVIINKLGGSLGALCGDPKLRKELVRRYNSHDALLATCTRMMVGITKESTSNCEWYEGIEHDGADEAKQAIAAAQDEPDIEKLKKESHPFYTCEFCGCDTNAHLRCCCEKGNRADLNKRQIAPDAK